MRTVFVWLVIVLSALSTRLAVAQQEPLMGSEATPLPGQVANSTKAAVPGFGGEDGIYRILIIGDGLAGGLGNGMIRIAEADPSFEILNRFNESSSLARPEVYDWAAAIPKIVENAPIDAMVVLVGLNDRQGIRDGNMRYVFKTPDWEKAYIAAIDNVLNSGKQANAKTFWISLPPMANSVFDADMRYLNDLHRARVAALGGQYVDVRPFFQGPDGGFIDRGPDDTGNERKLRESDGVKFMKVGNNRFGQLVLGAIKTLEAGAAPAVVMTPVVENNTPAVVADVAKPEAEKTITVVAMPPSFGQAGLNGEDLTFRADAVQPILKAPVSVAVKNAEQGQSIVTPGLTIKALPGSKAQQLLERGVMNSAPAGRFDDFAVAVSSQQ